MTVRSKAIRWLAAHKAPAGHPVTSKFYVPEESWTRARAWWVQSPAAAIRQNAVIHILCEAEPGSQSFRWLQVPDGFFKDHLDDFATIGDNKINLLLSAEPG